VSFIEYLQHQADSSSISNHHEILPDQILDSCLELVGSGQPETRCYLPKRKQTNALPRIATCSVIGRKLIPRAAKMGALLAVFTPLLKGVYKKHLDHQPSFDCRSQATVYRNFRKSRVPCLYFSIAHELRSRDSFSYEFQRTRYNWFETVTRHCELPLNYPKSAGD
jgi:hypothetical protein